MIRKPLLSKVKRDGTQKIVARSFQRGGLAYSLAYTCHLPFTTCDLPCRRRTPADAALPKSVSTMKIVIRTFFKILRVMLGPVMLLWEFVTRPKGLVRPPALQEKVDQACRSIVLYQYQTCPFCIKVRQEMRRLSLSIARLDAQNNAGNRQDLLNGGGQAKVPCLKVTDQAGNSRWIYESGEIIDYLRGCFAHA